MVVGYSVVLIFITIYSYALIDPNITFFNASWWMSVREPFIQLGYYQRMTSWTIYLFLIVLLYGFHFLIPRRKLSISPFSLACIIGGILFFSYPFLSHDFFNYMFDAKIFTFYHENPYLHKPMDFPQDQWLRFMHWTHRSYPYGPVFLVVSLIPSFLSLGKFILAYFFFKALFVGFYLASVWYLSKMEKRLAYEFATHPYILLEGVMVAHNDMIALGFGLAGYYYLIHNKGLYGRVMLMLSAGIKYLSFPSILLQKEKSHVSNSVALLLQTALIVYLSVTHGFQQWYLLSLFIYVPLFPLILRKLHILFFVLALSYYPYIYLGGWDTAEKMFLRNAIIYSGIILNAVYLGILYLKREKSTITFGSNS